MLVKKKEKDSARSRYEKYQTMSNGGTDEFNDVIFTEFSGRNCGTRRSEDRMSEVRSIGGNSERYGMYKINKEEMSRHK